jgi:predicted PurR-regulated permease PerM
MTVLNPLVTKLSKLRVPRSISVLVVYILVLGFFAAILAEVIPPLIEQSTSFANNLPDYISDVGISALVSDQLTRQLLSQIGSLPNQVVKLSFSIFSNVLSVVSVLIFAFYLLLIREKLNDQLGLFFGEDKVKSITRVFDQLETRLGGWARGELILMFLIGIFSYVGLILLGIPYALPLAILAGLLEIVPYFGPIISAIPPIIIGLSISPLTALATVALAILIHQSENYLLVPKIMEKSVGVSPIIVLLALAIGFRLIGIVGALISVPVVITIQILAKEYLPSLKK